MRSTIPLFLLLPVLACADAPARESEWAGTIRDSAGVSIVANPAEPMVVDGWTAQEVLRIGSAAGPEETQFGLIASVDVGSGGEIYVLDQQNRRVRVFTPEGEFLRGMGGAGSGPGELSDYAIVGLVTPGDTVLVGDLGNVRIERFGPAGEPLGSVPLPIPNGMMPNRLAMLEDGRLVERVRTVPTAANPELHDELLLVIGRNGAVEDTLLRLPAGRALEYRNGAAVLSAFAPEPAWVLGPGDRLYTAMSNAYRIEVRKRGRLERVITREMERRPVTEADRSAFRRQMRQSLHEQGASPLVIEEMLASLRFADHYPMFVDLVPGPRGTLWVQHVRTARDAEAEGVPFDANDAGSELWDVFDREGRFVTMVRLPVGFAPLTTHGDRFYGTWQDELDVQHVMVVEVLPAGEASAG